MRFRKALLQLEILAGLLWALPTAGADLSDTQLRSGLTQLAALVAADVPKNARWVLVAQSQGQRFGIFTQEEDVFRTEGNTFLFDETPGDHARILFMSTGALYPVFAEQEGGGRVLGLQEPGEQGFIASWKNADVAKDVAAAVEWLKKEAKRSKANTASASASPIDGLLDGDGNRDQFAMHQQTALYWAAVLQRTGHEVESLTLARAALVNADEKRRKQLLDGCFGRRAGKAFDQVMEDFAKQHDWSKLRDALAELLNQYPLGWNLRDAVRVLHHRVVERAKLPAVPPLMTTRPLSDADQKVLLAWLQEIEAGKQLEYSRWTLPALPHEEGEEGRPVQGNWSAFPRSHGIAAVPLLASLLGDDTLTLVDLHRRQGMGGFTYDGGNEEDAVTKLQRAYNSLPKPLTRAQLAWNLLERVLPSELRRSGSENFKEQAPEILAWYTSLKDATPADIALAYLEAGDNNRDVIQQAMTVTDPKKFARLENSMLEQAQVYDMSNLTAFVEKLGPAKGAAFVAKVRQKLEGELARFSSSDQGRQRKQMETGLKRLEAAAKGEKKKPDLKELLAMLAAYDQTAENEDQMAVREAFEEFPKLMRKRPAAERLELILAVLPDFKSPGLAVNMLNYALRGDPRDGGEKLKPEERLALLERTRPHWQKLLDAPLNESDEEEPLGLLIQLVAALEQLAAGEVQQDAMANLAVLGDRGSAILRQRATALLTGQKVEPLPRADSIKSEERQKLLADWGKKTVAEISRDLETLPLERVLALNETLLRSSDEVPTSMKEYIGLIQTVKIKGVADAAPWQAFRGKAWSKDTLVALAKQISSYSGGHLMVQLQRRAPLFGFKLHVSEVPKFSGNNWQANRLENVVENSGEKLPNLGKRLSTASFQQMRTNVQWVWLDAPKVEASKETAKAGNDDEAAESLQLLRVEELQAWEVLSTATSDAKAFPTSLVFLSAPTAALVKKD